MNLFEKLLTIQTEMSTVAKNLDVGVGKSSYKAVGEADVLRAVKELEAKYKVYSYPSKREIVSSEILQTEKEYNGQVTKGNQIFMRLKTTYNFVNVEEPSETISVDTYGDGLDTADKAPGKAMTYGDKYALMKAYKIVTGEDPDQMHSPDNAEYQGLGFISSTKVETLQNMIKDKGMKKAEYETLLAGFGVSKLEELKDNQFKDIYSKIKEN